MPSVADIMQYSDMCDKHGSDAVDDYMEFHDTLDSFEDCYVGEWDSEEDYNLEKMMGNLANYFDYEAPERKQHNRVRRFCYHQRDNDLDAKSTHAVAEKPCFLHRHQQ